MVTLRPLISETELTTFFKLFILCSKYSTIILLYENATISNLAPILLSTSNLSSIVINTDLARHDDSAKIYSDENSLIISVFDNDLIKKTNKSRLQYGLKYYCHYIFASNEINDNAQLNIQLIKYAEQYRIYNIVLILNNPNGSFKLFRIIYDQLLVVINFDLLYKDCSIYEKMFYPKTKDLKGEVKYAYAIFDPPRAINITSRKKDGTNGISMGGCEAYLASLIPRKINVTVKLFTVRMSDYYLNELKNHEIVFLKEFLEKAYEDDNLIPKQLFYITFVDQSWKE